MSFGLGDVTVAVQGALATLAALHHRDRTGEGQLVDVSQIDASVATLGEPLLDYQLNGRLPGPQENTHTAWFPHGIYAAAGDDSWLSLAVRDAREWRALARAIGRDDLAGDAGLLDVGARRGRAEEIDGAISSWCAGRDRDGAVEALAAVGVPAAPLLELEERNAHPHFTARGLLVDHEGGGFDPCRIYATPWLLSATPVRVTKPAPALGEDNAYVLGEILGMTETEIGALAEAGVVA
jgi:crotonobetainyl-CoA:carnitine CoA-transferase CaiB-like acyl-CoA transferase